MYVKELYTMYSLAYNLVANNNYDVLHIDEKKEEIWLEKYENKTSSIIRLIHQKFDWKNHLKKDIAQVFQKTKALKHLLYGKKIQIENVYIATHAPVDDWEVLKKPLQLNEKNPVKMHVYYLDESNLIEENRRLHEAIGIPSLNLEIKTDMEMEQYINFYKLQLSKALNNKRRERENLFSFGKPKLTYLLLIVNIFMYILLEMNGGSESIETLIAFGAKYNPAIMNGEWWRIISSMFLHIGIIHLLMNIMAIFYLGNTVEKIYGSSRFFIIYLLAGIGGGVASFAFTSNISAGASGALFGLFGALLFFGVNYKRIFFQTMGRGLLFIIGINIVFGFTVPQIDNAAHLGGLITGFIAAAIVQLPKKQKHSIQFSALIGYIVIVSGVIFLGAQHYYQSAEYHLITIEQLLKENKYEAAVESATKALDKPGKLAAPLLFQRSYAYIELNEIDLAIADLEESIQGDNDIPEAYFNLALLYNETGEKKKAVDAITKAYNKKPEDSAFIDLYEQLTGKSVKQ